MLLVMVESIFVSLLLVLVILLVANPIQAKIAADQRISSNNTMTSNVQTLPRTFILDSSLVANANEVKSGSRSSRRSNDPQRSCGFAQTLTR